MLDPRLDQGAGLRRHTPQASPRLAALVGQGDAPTELPLLWQLCGALQDLGYQIAVLDATTEETAEAPGLRELLDGSLAAFDDHSAEATGPRLSIFAAAQGMHRLALAPSVDRLARALHPHDIALLYGDARTVGSWLPHCPDLLPVLAASPLPSGVLAAYRSLKTLVDAGVVPIVASVVTRTGLVTAGSARAARDNLARCAAAWLGCRIDVLRVRAATDGAATAPDVHRLALRLLEGAATLGPEPVFPPFEEHEAADDTFFERSARSH